MACFTVPLATAAAATASKNLVPASLKRNPFVAKLGWFAKMMFGGSFLLAIEHVYHGEIIFAPPFLAAVRDGETSSMLAEMATRGVAMTLLITAVWVVMVIGSTVAERARNVSRSAAGV